MATKNIDTSAYKDLGCFYWKHFTEKGNYNPGVSSTAPRVEFMQYDGQELWFFDHKRQEKYAVKFDASYVFEYFHRKIVINMGWQKSDKSVDTELLAQFFHDFLSFCESVPRDEQLRALESKQKELEAVMAEVQALRNATEVRDPILTGERDYHDEKNPSDNRERDDDMQCFVVDVDNDYVEPQGETFGTDNDNDEEMISMDDYDPDTEEDIDLNKLGIRELKKIATNLKIKGYGNMNKNELVLAIQATAT
ncbi:Rho termination factor N-terminal domain-containing protein [Nostoc sp. TCL240-02]|uniref:Rho termination factor N-terminal domain-containing protein n=1 Tax=Nostoc sp. TCL240-02 TaxID=2572090 RepID=UPI00157F8129|nr:Rho termination factor N-terminal domain-containing protein [Nostoc sp. TCL240-02]QKQ76352.1 hypothetical protein FBB35_26445 [Nostoc sp. TCL240-02]